MWWFSGCDDYSYRNKLTEQKPYRCGPDILGTFATRSPLRPNPIALSCSGITYVDVENGVIGLSYIDAYDGSSVLDIKLYVPSLDKVSDIIVPIGQRMLRIPESSTGKENLTFSVNLKSHRRH